MDYKKFFSLPSLLQQYIFDFIPKCTFCKIFLEKKNECIRCECHMLSGMC